MDCSQLEKGDMTLISRFFLFSGTDGVFVLRALSDSLCELAEYEKGAVVVDEEDCRHSVGLLLSGEMTVSTPEAGSRYLMRTIAPGGAFGAAALFTSDRGYVTVLRAAKPCRVVFFPQELIERLMRENIECAMSYVRFLSGRVRFLNAKIRLLVSPSSDRAVARYLVRRSADGGTVSCGSLKSLAESLNIGRTSLYRSLEALEARGMIKKNGKDVEILDPDALSAVK